MEEKKYPFVFSIIMSVYNVEPYIREAVDSVLAQDFGFERVQLIMVDDGSTDGSGAICDEYGERYPENVVVIHKENGGLSSARNAGVKVSQGKYLNFFDPDDLLDKQVLSSVYKFFEAHEEETDIVAIPIKMFEGMQGLHPSCKKFSKGNRVIDLEQEWWSFQMSLAAAFLKASAAKECCFEEDLVMACAEDARELVKIFTRRPTLGVVCDGQYRYRIRKNSQTGDARQKKMWYIPYLRDYCEWSITYVMSHLGRVPKNLQYTILYDLQIKLRQDAIPEGVMTEEEFKEYRGKMDAILACMDDDVIMAQDRIFTEQKSYILTMKYGQKPKKIWASKLLLYTYGGYARFSTKDFGIRLEFAQLIEDRLLVEGWLPYYRYLDDTISTIVAECNGEVFEAVPIERTEVGAYVKDELYRRVGFRFELPLSQDDRNSFQFLMKTEYGNVQLGKLRCEKYFPICEALHSSYYWKDGWKLTMNRGRLEVTRCGRKGWLKSELAFCKELWKLNRKGMRKAVFVRLAAHILKAIKNKKKLWLIADKANRADDNGEALFQYLQTIKPENIKSVFLVGKDSPDYKRLKNRGKVVSYMSWRHKLLYLIADDVISAYSHRELNNPFYGYHNAYRDMLQNCRYIFLQHGVTKADVSRELNRYQKNIRAIMCAAQREYDSILYAPAYGYTSEHLFLTGFPRYDYLYHEEENAIVIMPTWRRNLMGEYHPKNSQWDLRLGFQESEYYQFFNGLLNHKRLLKKAAGLGYVINFVPHPVLFPYIDQFCIPDQVRVWGADVTYRDMFAKNKLLVTDFSSVAFDFAYLKKPVIYAQFDASNYSKGYFDDKRDGFGEVECDLESTVDRIIEYMENGCKLKDKYRERIDHFFAFHDKKNCERVYEAILKCEKEPRTSSD